jgi:hypothetical protein
LSSSTFYDEIGHDSRYIVLLEAIYPIKQQIKGFFLESGGPIWYNKPVQILGVTAPLTIRSRHCVVFSDQSTV